VALLYFNYKSECSESRSKSVFVLLDLKTILSAIMAFLFEFEVVTDIMSV
jgi:hypothetical protein